MNDSTIVLIPFAIFLIPIIIGILISKKYNIIFGFISIFTISYFIDFIFIRGKIIPNDFLASMNVNIINGIVAIENSFVNPVLLLIYKLLITFKLETVSNFIAEKGVWVEFAFFFLIHIVLHVISSSLKKRKKKYNDCF